MDTKAVCASQTIHKRMVEGARDRETRKREGDRRKRWGRNNNRKKTGSRAWGTHLSGQYSVGRGRRTPERSK